MTKCVKNWPEHRNELRVRRTSRGTPPMAPNEKQAPYLTVGTVAVRRTDDMPTRSLRNR
jgi:hypothetical protein